jgi:hypothetical protein
LRRPKLSTRKFSAWKKKIWNNEFVITLLQRFSCCEHAAGSDSDVASSVLDYKCLEYDYILSG